MERRIVVTGASGHIGYHIGFQLLELGYPVTLLIRKENVNTIRLASLGAGIHLVDFKIPNTFISILEQAQVLFHVAAENTVDTTDEGRVLENTFELTRSVIDTAIKGGVKKIIYTSSVVVLGRSSSPSILITENDKTTNLESPYVKGKYLAEQYVDEVVEKKQVDIRRLYPSWVVGSNDAKLTPPGKTIDRFCKRGQSFYFDGGISVACVKSVARAHIDAWLIGKPNEKYIVAGNNISFKDFYSTLSKFTNHKAPFIYVPKSVILFGSVAGKFLFGNKIPIHPNYVKTVIGKYSWYNSEKAIRELNYKIPEVETILGDAIINVQQKRIGLDKLFDKKIKNLLRIEYDADDVLLITGFPGWLGLRMVDIFINADRFGNNAVNRRVKLLVQHKYSTVNITLPPNFEIIYGDITNRQNLREALKDVKTVYHIAGAVYPKKRKSYYKINFEGTKNLVDLCVERKIRRILFMSTDSVCGFAGKSRVFDEKTEANPYSEYGESKYLAEKYIFDKTKEGLIDGTSLRGFWFFGPNSPERNLKFFKMFYWPRQLVFGNGKNYRSISHIDNIVQAFIRAEGHKETIGRWYWIANKPNTSTVSEIYINIANALGVTYKPLYIPTAICKLIGIVDTLITMTGKVSPTLHAAGKFYRDIAGVTTAAEADFDFNPDITFEQIKQEIREEILL